MPDIAAVNAPFARAEEEYAALERALADPSVGGRPDELKRLARAIGQLEPVVSAWRALRAIRA
ncbi:MAG: hypothetical protein AAB368_11285, partial [bacterium]